MDMRLRKVTVAMGRRKMPSRVRRALLSPTNTYIHTCIHKNIIYSYIHQGGLSNYHVPVRAAASYPFTHGPEEFSPTASSSPHRGTSRKGIPASMESHGSTSHLLSTSAALLSPSDRYVCMYVCKNRCVCMYVCMFMYVCLCMYVNEMFCSPFSVASTSYSKTTPPVKESHGRGNFNSAVNNAMSPTRKKNMGMYVCMYVCLFFSVFTMCIYEFFYYALCTRIFMSIHYCMYVCMV